MTNTPTKRSCTDCGKRLPKPPKTGLCRACIIARNKKPDQWCADCDKLLSTQNRLGRCRICSLLHAAAELRKTPEHMELLRSVGRRNVHTMHTPECLAKSIPKRREAARARGDRLLSWCPPAYREQYFRHMRAGNKNARIARSLVMATIDSDRLARLTTYDNLNAAMDYLRRYTPVFKREDGYTYGTATLSPSQLIQRALDKGWQPQRWAA